MADEIRRANEAAFEPEIYENTYFEWRGLEIGVGYPYAMKYPADWIDEHLRERAVDVFYFRHDKKSPWILYRIGQGKKARAVPVNPEERRRCIFYGELVFLENGKLKRRTVTRTGWDDAWNTAVHGSEPVVIPVSEFEKSEFAKSAAAARDAEAARLKELAQRANEFDDVVMPPIPPPDDELGDVLTKRSD